MPKEQGAAGSTCDPTHLVHKVAEHDMADAVQHGGTGDIHDGHRGVNGVNYIQGQGSYSGVRATQHEHDGTVEDQRIQHLDAHTTNRDSATQGVAPNHWHPGMAPKPSWVQG
jgi:hypothetical protein